MQQLFITVAYYIGDSENIEQMPNELCILLLDTDHSEIRGYGLYKKGTIFRQRISQYNPILRPVYCLQYFVSQSFHTQIIVLSPYIDVFVIKII